MSASTSVLLGPTRLICTNRSVLSDEMHISTAASHSSSTAEARKYTSDWGICLPQEAALGEKRNNCISTAEWQYYTQLLN